MNSLYGIGLNFGLGQNGYLSQSINKKLINENLTQIIFTRPGERVNLPNFGVGIERYLFEQNTNYTAQQIETVMRQQINTYLPVVNILSISFELQDNILYIKLVYNIPNIGTQTLVLSQNVPT